MVMYFEFEKGIWRIIDEDGIVKDSVVSLYYYNLEWIFCLKLEVVLCYWVVDFWVVYLIENIEYCVCRVWSLGKFVYKNV